MHEGYVYREMYTVYRDHKEVSYESQQIWCFLGNAVDGRRCVRPGTTNGIYRSTLTPSGNVFLCGDQPARIGHVCTERMERVGLALPCGCIRRARGNYRAGNIERR